MLFVFFINDLCLSQAHLNIILQTISIMFIKNAINAFININNSFYSKIKDSKNQMVVNIDFK